MTGQLGDNGVRPANVLPLGAVFRGRGLVGLLVATGLAGLAWSCDRNPTRPSSVNTGSVPTNPVISLEVTGPPSIAPGDSAQFTATAGKADGTSEDFTSQVTWRSSNAAVATVSPTGLVTAVASGECYLEVVYKGLQGQPAGLLVVPPGTYRLAGQVTDGGLGSTVPVEGARVEVVAGVGRGLTALTNPGGSYALFGVAGDVEVRVTKDGYRTEDRRVVVNESTQNLDVAMTPVDAYQNLAGRYLLTITAGSCTPGSQSLPDQLRQRSYLSLLTQTGGRLHVTLDDPGTGGFEGFLPGANAFEGFIQPDQILFRLNGYDPYYYYYYYSVGQLSLVERVSFGWLLIWGNVEADVGRDAVSGLLDGEMLLFPSTVSLPAPHVRTLGGCYAHDMRFAMVRK
jgi:hypothetical protein